MQFVIVIFCFFIFFYSLYILGKDDYVLIRKNLSLEQLFDFAFIGIFAGLILARVLSIVFHPAARGTSFISQLFSPTGAGFYLTSIVLGCMLVLYLMGKYRKLPIGRLFDFFSLALLSALPAGYLLSILFAKRSEIIYYVFPGIFYLIAQVFFWRFLLPNIISGKLRDGTLCSLFLLTFSSISLFVSLFYKFSYSSMSIEPDEFILIGIFFGGFLSLLRINRRQIIRRKTM